MPIVNRKQAIPLAMRLQREGKFGEAESIYRQILQHEPLHVDALHLLGVAAAQAGRHDEAIGLILRATELKSNISAFHGNLGKSLCKVGRLREAAQAFVRASQLNPTDVPTLMELAGCNRQLGNLDEAIQQYQRVSELMPDDPESYAHLGQVQRELRRFPEAIAACRRAVQLKPDNAEFSYHLGNAFRDAGEWDNAESQYRKAIELNPEYGAAYNNLGNTLRDAGRVDQAVVAYTKAVELFASHPPAWNNLAIAYQEQGRFDEATATFEKALSIDPSCPETRLFRAMLILLRGDMARGWEEYEWRLKIKGLFKKTDFGCPEWDGTDLAGKTLLLHHEQGFGDTIMFARYARLLAAKGARIAVDCQTELRSLFSEGLEGVSTVVTQQNALPKPPDAHLSFLSCPHRFSTQFDSIPFNRPYLKARADRQEYWRSRLSEQNKGKQQLNVGLVWAGKPGHKNDRNRSMSLRQLAPLAAVPGVQFLSLQKDAPRITDSSSADIALADWTTELTDFAQTGALVANLDLVISVDTAVAHLAGALGRPVWTLLPFVPDWRWLLNRDDCPWYPSMRLYRQPRSGDWETVLSRVTDDLSQLAANR